MKGFFGKLLQIDLTGKTQRSTAIPEAVQRTYLVGIIRATLPTTGKGEKQ